LARTTPDPDERFEQNIVIAAPPAAVFDCFFKADALRAWWQAGPQSRCSVQNVHPDQVSFWPTCPQ
jgi:uncharacterized protein YndB with AHSA1/START domain